MNITEIVSQLKTERTRIEAAISALEGLSSNGAAKSTATRNSKGPQRGRGISAEGRKRISVMMKKRWAERRKAMAGKKK